MDYGVHKNKRLCAKAVHFVLISGLLTATSVKLDQTE